MILGIADSVNGVPVRLTDERWEHILDSHPELGSLLETVLEAVQDPEYILRGYKGTLIAAVHLGARSYLNVVYRELGKTDGFIVTARIERQLNRSKIIWRRDNLKTR
ncbi:MAG TPA: hypothetical protein VJT71_16805 [Pyrinomonadaceae bacterium]|nr:hypothetical protein [Pyrinomonadaceae bacterium]